MVRMGWVPPPFQVVHHGRCIQIGAIVELDARPQGKGPGQAAGRHAPALGQAGSGGRVPHSVLDQRLIDLARHQKRYRIRFLSRIQARWILLQGKGEHVASRDGVEMIKTIRHWGIHLPLSTAIPQALPDTGIGRHRCSQRTQQGDTANGCEQNCGNRLCHSPSQN